MTGMGLEQLDIFESEGVSGRVLIVSHIGFPDRPAGMLGAYCSSAGPTSASICASGRAPSSAISHWVKVMAIWLFARDTPARSSTSRRRLHFLLSVTDSTSRRAVFDDYTYIITRVFLQTAKRAGVTDEQINVTLAHEPAVGVLALPKMMETLMNSKIRGLSCWCANMERASRMPAHQDA